MTMSLEHHVKDFLTEFTGDECFLAVPHEIAEASIKIEAFADDAAPFYAFDASFLKAIGIEASIGGRLIEQPQCPALAFVRAYPYGNPAPIDSDDPDRTVNVGDILTVSVAAARVRRLTLMLISPDGTILDLTDYLRREGKPLGGIAARRDPRAAGSGRHRHRPADPARGPHRRPAPARHLRRDRRRPGRA